MIKIVSVIFAVSVIATTAIAQSRKATDENRLGNGAGFQSCAQFAKNFATSPSVENVYFSWAQGFMTGWNIALGKQEAVVVDLSAMTIDVQKKWLRDYCDKYPLKNYLDGVSDLMARMAYLKPPKLN